MLGLVTAMVLPMSFRICGRLTFRQKKLRKKALDQIPADLREELDATQIVGSRISWKTAKAERRQFVRRVTSFGLEVSAAKFVEQLLEPPLGLHSEVLRGMPR